MQPRRTSSFGLSACTSAPSKMMEPLVTSPRSADEQIGDRLERGRLAGAIGAEQSDDLARAHLQRDALEHQDDVVVDDLDVVDRRIGATAESTAFRLPFAGSPRGGRRRHRRLLAVWRPPWPASAISSSQQPTVIFFSAAYLAAASLTMGRSTVVVSRCTSRNVMFQFLPSQVWMRPVRAPSWSAHETLIGFSSPSKPSCLSGPR